jgi:hypothetical protein
VKYGEKGVDISASHCSKHIDVGLLRNKVAPKPHGVTTQKTNMKKGTYFP